MSAEPVGGVFRADLAREVPGDALEQRDAVCPCQNPHCARRHDTRALLLAILTNQHRLESAFKAHGVGEWAGLA